MGDAEALPISARQRLGVAHPGPRPMSGSTRGSPHRHGSATQDHRRAVAEQALVGGDADPGALDLAAARLAAQLPGQLADLGQRLGRHRLAEAGEPAGRVDRDPAADRGVAGAEQLLGLAALAQRRGPRIQSSSRAVDRS